MAAEEAACTAEETTAAIVVGEVGGPGEEGAAGEEVEAGEQEVVVVALEGPRYLRGCLARWYMSCTTTIIPGRDAKAWTFGHTALAQTTRSHSRLPCLTERFRMRLHYEIP